MKISKKVLAVGAVALSLSLIAGCSSSSNAAKMKACLALDTGGVDDKSFNASAWQGAQDAKAANKNLEVKYLAAASDADYAPNIKALIDEKCDIVIGVGFAINGAIVDAAKANPETKFAIVDQDGMDHGPKGDQYPGTAISNLKPLQFATDQSSFQAGYLAAGYSKTGKVATYGGMPFPTVTIFMDAFAKGVAYYNKQKGKSVKVLGWDTAKKNGTFVGNFSDQAKALQISKNFEQQGADVIFPVAGGLGAATAGQSMSSGKSVTIWVDSDGFVQVPQYASVLITSVMKGVGLSVKEVIQTVIDGKFSADGYLGTLQNGGTFLAPYHDFDSKVDATLKDEVKKLGEDIASGAFKTS